MGVATLRLWLGKRQNPFHGVVSACRRLRDPLVDSHAPPLWVKELRASIHTGDVFLMSSRRLSSHLTKVCTLSPWDHVAVVVCPSPDEAYLVECGRHGVFATELSERLVELQTNIYLIELHFTCRRDSPLQFTLGQSQCIDSPLQFTLG